MTIPIFDGHLDMAMNARRSERDQRLTVEAIRIRESGGVADARGQCAVSLPEMRKGNVAVVMSTVLARCKPWVDPGRSILRGDIDYPDETIAYSVAQGELAYYRLLETLGEIRIIESTDALRRHFAQFHAGKTTCIGVIVTMEGADPIVEPRQLDVWHGQGVRTLMLAHFGHSRYAAGTPGNPPADDYEMDIPLTDLGVELLAQMDELLMPLDLTHLSDQSFYHAADVFGGRVYSSHSACRAIAGLPRNHTDEQLKIIVDRQGVVGVPLFNAFLSDSYTPKSPPDSVTIEQIALHLDHICQLAGSAKHAAIGSDLDGGFGAEHTPSGIDTIADLHKIGEALASRGYADDDIKRIMHGNWLDFFLQTLP